MVEFAQSVPNLTEASSNLYELIKGRSLAVYSDAEMRLAVARCVALETSRGWRIAKEKTSHKIDVVVALAMTALGAAQGGQTRNFWMKYSRPISNGWERERGFSNGLCANPNCRKNHCLLTRRTGSPADSEFCSLQCSW